MYSSYYPHGQHQPHGQHGVRPEFIRDVEMAVNGEYSAIQCYQRLAGMAPNQEQRNLILEIRNDEIRHYHYFTQLYTALTGRQPSPKITEECPSEYRRGLRFSFEDEQKTVDFYLKMSDIAPDTATRDTLRRIAADEQQHAVWFLSLLTLPYPGV